MSETSEKSNDSDSGNGCSSTLLSGLVVAVVFAIIAAVIQANVLHFAIAGGAIGILLGLFGRSPAEAKKVEVTEEPPTKRKPPKPTAPISKPGKDAKQQDGATRGRKPTTTSPRRRRKEQPKPSPTTAPSTVVNPERLGLEKELNDYRVRREEKMSIIRSSTLDGKLSKNADFRDAQERIEIYNKRIAELAAEMASLPKLTTIPSSKRVSIGSKVVVKEHGNDVGEEYRIVSSRNAGSGISASSPVGQALIGKSRGDKIRVETPGGKRTMTIIDIR